MAVKAVKEGKEAAFNFLAELLRFVESFFQGERQ